MNIYQIRFFKNENLGNKNELLESVIKETYKIFSISLLFFYNNPFNLNFAMN